MFHSNLKNTSAPSYLDVSPLKAATCFHEQAYKKCLLRLCYPFYDTEALSHQTALQVGSETRGGPGRTAPSHRLHRYMAFHSRPTMLDRRRAGRFKAEEYFWRHYLCSISNTPESRGGMLRREDGERAHKWETNSFLGDVGEHNYVQFSD